MSLLSQLWCGEVQPARSLENSSAEICHLSELICKNREQLEAGLTDEQKERLARCMELRTNIAFWWRKKPSAAASVLDCALLPKH